MPISLHLRLGQSLIVAALLVVRGAQAATWYVAPPPHGQADNPGTAERPFATIQAAAAVAGAGDTVWISPGLYQPTEEIRPAYSGTPDAPIVFRAAPGGEVIIDGQFRLPLEKTRKMGILSIEDRNWIVLDGLTFIHSRWAGVLVRRSTGITVQRCTTRLTYASGIIAAQGRDIKVLHNRVQQACVDPGDPRKDVDECITLASVDTFEVAYNTVSDRPTDTSNGGEGIDIKNASRNGSVHHNVVHDVVRLGIYCDSFSKVLENVDVYANTVFRCGKGIVVACEDGGTARHLRIHDNVIYDCRNMGLQLAGYLKGGPIQDVVVYQNTIVGCGLGRRGAQDGGLTVDTANPANRDLVVRNNILAGNFNQAMTRNQPTVILDRNLLHGPSLATGTNAIAADPRFVDPEAHDFRLTAGSPAIDAALGTPLSATDHADRPRTPPGDLGAFEWSPSPSLRQH